MNVFLMTAAATVLAVLATQAPIQRTNAQTVSPEVTESLQACLYVEGTPSAAMCERAYLLITELRAEYRYDLALAKTNPGVEAAVRRATAEMTRQEIDKALSPEEVLLGFTLEQLMTSYKAGDSEAIKTAWRQLS
jgi:hypothetical protein